MSSMDSALAAANDGRWGHMGGWGGGWMWLWGVVMMILFAVFVVWLVRSVSGGRESSAAPGHPTDRAREILAERYARGELTTDEYRERSEQLR